MIHRGALVASILSILAPLAAFGEQGVLDWINANAQPLASVELAADTADLQPLKLVVGDARVVAFGEGMHNTHEFWAVRNRLFAYLVEELGFTAIALETGYYDSLVADEYVQGASVDRLRAAQSVFSWTRSVYAENLELIDWMRSYNARPTTQRKLRLYGLELLTCGEFDGRRLVDTALAFAARLDPDSVRPLQQAFDPLLSQFNDAGHAKLGSDRQAALLAAVQDLVSLFERSQADWIARTSSQAYQRAYHHATVARQLIVHLRSGTGGRDIADAQNLRWVLEREGRLGRVFVFAHNGHVIKRRELPEKHGELVRVPFGELAHDALGEDMRVIGSLFDRGEAREIWGLFGPVHSSYTVPPSQAGSLNAMLARAAAPTFVLDLRALPASGAVRRWFEVPRGLRHVNGYVPTHTLAAFDALLFVAKVSPQRIAVESAPGECGSGAAGAR